MKFQPFIDRVAYPAPTADYSSKKGALKLAEQVRRYWADRGYDIAAGVAECGFVPNMRSCWWEIRSDMHNGLPRGYRGDRGNAS